MQVQDIMTENPMCAEPSTSLQDIARMMADCDCGGIPICDPQPRRLVGFVTDRDIVVRTLARGLNPMQMSAQDAMTTDLHTIGPNADLEECIRTMQRHKVRRVPVTNDQGQIVGIVSQADLARRATAMQPEMAEEVEETLEEISAPKMAI